MKVFVTGATGLIGNSAVRALVAGGHTVTGLTSRASNAAAVERAGARAVVGDMRDASVYRAAASEADAIVHAAAAMPDKTRFSRADVDAMMGSDEEAVEALTSVVGPACRAFVFSSGAYVYGETGTAPIDETHTTDGHYPAMTRKIATEKRLLDLARAGKLPAIVVRPGMVYGNGSLWAKLYLDAMKKRRRAMQPGRGDNVISFVHVDDVGTAYRTLVEHPTPGEIYNLADDRPVALREIVRAQAAALAAPAPIAVPGWLIRLAAGPFGGPPLLGNNALSNRKLRALGWTPAYPTYERGVVALAESLRS